jgi:hypothetical protein
MITQVKHLYRQDTARGICITDKNGINILRHGGVDDGSRESVCGSLKEAWSCCYVHILKYSIL